VIAACLAVYAMRGPIAERLAQDWLSRHGVASSLKVEGLSLTGFTASLRLGDPTAPDLTVERLEVGYSLSGPWNGQPFAVQTRSLRLVRPRLRVRLTPVGLSFGALQPLIDEAAKQPPSKGPPPDITVEDGLVVLTTPQGELLLHGRGALRTGAASGFQVQADPFQLVVSGARLSVSGGELRLARPGDRWLVAGQAGPTSVVDGARRVSAAQASMSGDLPDPSHDGRWLGPARLAMSLNGVEGSLGGAHATGGVLSAALDGALDATAASQTFSGHLLLNGELTSIVSQPLDARGARFLLNLAHLTLVRRPDASIALADGVAGASALLVDRADTHLALQAAATRVRGLQILLHDNGVSAAVRLDGSAEGRGGVSAAGAARLARSVPVFSGEPAYRSAMEQGARAFRVVAPHWSLAVSDSGARLFLPSPLQIDSDSGARLMLAGSPAGITFGPSGIAGAAAVALQGGGLPSLRVQLRNASASSSGLQADIAAQGSFDALFVRGGQVQLEGRLIGGGRSVRIDLDGCTPVSAQRLAFDPNSLTAVSASLCPGDGPLLEVSDAGWVARARLADAHADVPNLSVRLQGGAGATEAHGRTVLEGATLALDGGALADTTDPIRFRPFRATGKAVLLRGVWTGDFTGVTPAGHAIGTMHLHHDVASGSGRIDIDASRLAFAPNGLQPFELTPMAGFAREADGPAGFRGWFAWRPGGPSSSGGELVANGPKFKSPLGLVLGIEADLHFSSLSPLVSAPDQTIAIGLVDAITPLRTLAAEFKFDTQSVSIASASGGIAKGRIFLEPTVASFAAGSTTRGVLVVDHVSIADIIGASNLSEVVKTDAVVDGRIPFEYGPAGLTIQHGQLAAVRPGRISISRKALTGGSNPAEPADASTGFAQDLAYQAMENLAFDQLDASVNSLPNDRLGIVFHIKGRHDPPQRQGATIAVRDLLRGKALAKPLTLPSDTKIDLTLDTSLNFGELVRALSEAWRESTGGAEPPRSAAVQRHEPSVTSK
jgi:hypothetical protein